MGFVDLLKERAKKSIKTIVLPETEDMRTIEATDKILKEGVAKIILIGNEEEINKKAAEEIKMTGTWEIRRISSHQ